MRVLGIPWPAFLAVWTAVLLASVAWMGRRWTLLLLLFPPVLGELWLGNLNILLGLAIVLGMRWPAAWAFIVLTKITPGIGLLWFAVRGEWRLLAIALGATAAIAAASFAVAPWLWADFLEAAQTQLGATVDVPRQAVPISLPVRLVLAALVVAWGARTDRAWVLPVAVALSVPFLWWNVLAIVIAAIPLAGWATRSGADATQPARLMRLDLDRLWLYLAVALPALVSLLVPLPAVDLAYQVRAGEEILRTGVIPAVDTYTFTVAGTPWTDQQWLAQVLLALGFRAGGWELLVVLRAALVSLSIGLLVAAAMARGARVRTASILGLVTFALAAPALALRPQLFAITIFAALLLLVAKRHRDPRAIWLAPLLVLRGPTSTGPSSSPRSSSATPGWTTLSAADRRAAPSRCSRLPLVPPS